MAQQTINKEQLIQNENQLNSISEEITEEDYQLFLSLINTKLNSEQEERIINPLKTYPEQKEVLALHWHPEFIPMDLIASRVNNLFPNRTEDLIIPTQHNKLMKWGSFAGVEIDCFSLGFNRKVQLLLHLHESKLKNISTLESMLEHTFKYRSGQLFEYINTILEPSMENRIQQAAGETGTSEDLVIFIQIQTMKLYNLLKEHESKVPPQMIRNKLLINYVINSLKDVDESISIRVTHFLKTVKRIVKANFSIDYFYRTREVIEEARSVGAGIVIPHPEQFWPVLLADYDVDGYEVWNPQSQEYTEFLINVVTKGNLYKRYRSKPLLIFMGDDTHFGEKVKDPAKQDKAKASREIGIQPAWDDITIKRSLDKARTTRGTIIKEYKERLIN